MKTLETPLTERKQLKSGDTVSIFGRRWFQRTYGNTYHSVEVYVNGDKIGSIDFDYGYGDQYLQNGEKLLRRMYDLPLDKNAALWQLRYHGINVVNKVTDVERKKDL